VIVSVDTASGRIGVSETPVGKTVKTGKFYQFVSCLRIVSTDKTTESPPCAVLSLNNQSRFATRKLLIFGTGRRRFHLSGRSDQDDLLETNPGHGHRVVCAHDSTVGPTSFVDVRTVEKSGS
jgi:hypothetical protein